MNNRFKNFLRITSIIVAITMLSTGCTSNAPTGSDFEDVVYEIKLNTNSSESEMSDTSSIEDTTQSSVNENSSNEDASDVEAQDEKPTDPTFVQNWPELLNPNGFNINSVQNAIKFSCVDGRITASTLLPSVAYLENDIARDVMFNGFIFMGSNTFFYDYGDDDGGKRPMTKKDWLNYIYTYEFREGYSVDALENAVGQVKNALEMPDYKAGVFLCLSAPVKSITNWGELNGKNLNFSVSNEDRIAALKWFVDEQIKAFNEKNYENIELCGFYYYHESLGDDDLNFLPAITDYVRSLKYITIWSPYYKASGYDRWKDYGFDRVAMQANYFAGRTDLPNYGGKERVASNAAITASRGMGYEMETCGINPENITGIKEYYRVGVSTGFMNRWHTWWFAGDLKGVKNLYKSNDPYVQSAYKEMYLFLNNKLQLTDITTE